MWIVGAHFTEGSIVEGDEFVAVLSDVYFTPAAVGSEANRSLATDIACRLHDVSCPLIIWVEPYAFSCACIGDECHCGLSVLADSLYELEAFCKAFKVGFWPCEFHFAKASRIALSVLSDHPEAGCVVDVLNAQFEREALCHDA